MAALGTFEEFLATGVVQIDLTYLVIALVLSAILASILGKLYVRYGKSLSASNFR